MQNTYFKIPLSLSDDVRFVDASPIQQAVFIRLVSLAAFKPVEHNIKGNIITIEPGQLCYTLRGIADLCGKHFSKNHIERSIAYFQKVGFLRQELRHGKSLITITHLDTYKLIKNDYETGFETNLRQTRDRLETQKNNYNNYNIENISKDTIAQTAPRLRKKDPIFFCFNNNKFEGITDEDFASWKIAYPSIDIHQELAKSSQWCISNPSKAKSKKLWRKFITGWFQRTEENKSNRAAYASGNKPIDRRTKEKDGNAIESPADGRF